MIHMNLLIWGLKLETSSLIYKAFDKVWYDGTVFKLTQNRISRNLLKLLQDFLEERKRRIVLNWQVSTWKNITARAPHCSILDPLLFLTYLNDITGGLICKTRLFTNDTSLLADNTQTSVNDLNKDLKAKNNWAF